MISKYERGLDAFPHIAAHRLAWCALGRARLNGAMMPSAEYERALNSLMARFLAARSVPSADEFAAGVQRCLDELRRAEVPGILVPVERDDVWKRAARWLVDANDYARVSLDS